MSNYHVELVRRVRLDDIPARQQGTCKNVLGWIAYHANESEADIAYPGVETLELETGLRAKAIVTATETLAEHEWITKKRRLGTSNIYRINVHKLRDHYVPKPPSKVSKLIDELPGLGFSHESEPGSDADPNPAEPEPAASDEPASDKQDTSENTYPQATDQHLCSEDMTGMSSEHGNDAVTTRQGRRQNKQTIRESSGSHQPTSADVPASDSTADDFHGSTNDGWGKSAPQKTKTEEPDSPGARLLRTLRAGDGTGLSAAAIAEHANQVTAWLEAGHTDKSIRLHLSGGRSAGFIRSKLRKLAAGQEHLPARRVDLRPMHVRPAQQKTTTPENLAELAGPQAYLPTRLQTLA